MTTTFGATDLVELVCRNILKDHPDLPLFIQTGIHPKYRYEATPAAEERVAMQWTVRLVPILDGVAVSGAGQYDGFGYDNVGETVVVKHGTSWQDPDPNVIGGDEFWAAVVAAAEAKAAEVQAAREAWVVAR